MSIQRLIELEDMNFAKYCAVDGAFPLKLESVQHYGTMQRYPCFQAGGNSEVIATISDLWEYALDQFPEREFLIEGRGREGTSRLTFLEVITAARHLAQELAVSFGVSHRSVVALAGRNTSEWVISFIAASMLHATILPLNAWLTDEDLYYCLKHSETGILLVDGERLAKTSFESCGGLAAVICLNRSDWAILDTNLPSFGDLVRRGAQRGPLPSLAPPAQEDMAMLMFTSGSTSQPKGVPLTQRQVMSAINTLRLMEHDPESGPRERPQTVQLVPVPLFHVNGTHNMLLSGAAAGRKLVLMPKWGAGEALRLVQVTHLNPISTPFEPDSNPIVFEPHSRRRGSQFSSESRR